MKYVSPKSALLILILSAALQVRAESEPAGYIDFGKFTPSKSGGEFVEVNIKNNLISMVARMAEKAEPEVTQVLKGLKAVRVNVIALKDDNRDDVKERLLEIREKLDNKGWERIVTAQKSKEDVSVYLKLRESEAIEGLVVTVLEGDKNAVLVNIVGEIKPEQIAMVGEKLNIDPLKKIGHSIEKH